MKLTDQEYESIKQEVIDILARYDIRCTPISGFEIAQKMGIIVMPYSALTKKQRQAVEEISSDGCYMEPGDGREYIIYNDTEGYARSNMTLLHEIGHCVLGHDDDTDPALAEAEANFFAKYIIAPPPLIHQIKPTCPEDIQKYFCVSHQAACNALNYYHKWLCYGGVNYTTYELVLLHQFQIAVYRG
jgi:Zn-dependent peptidase ImmA (M78 family)